MEKINVDIETGLLETNSQDNSKPINKVHDYDSKIKEAKEDKKADYSNRNNNFKISYFNPATGKNEEICTTRIKTN